MRDAHYNRGMSQVAPSTTSDNPKAHLTHQAQRPRQFIQPTLFDNLCGRALQPSSTRDIPPCVRAHVTSSSDQRSASPVPEHAAAIG